jgi:DNA-binding NarL/FixJ family response regulator
LFVTRREDHNPPMVERNCILIADDHPLMRSALAQAVCQALPKSEIVEAGTLDEVVRSIRLRPAGAPLDLILLDLNMPGMSGFSGFFLIRLEFPAIPIIVVSASEDSATVSRASDYGASGFIPKSAPCEQIAEAIHSVLSGDLWFPAQPGLVSRNEDAELADRLAAFTPQQLRVFTMIAEGKLNKQIAHDIGVTEATVKAHVTMILRKLGVVSRTQAVIAAGGLLVASPLSVRRSAGAPSGPIAPIERVMPPV